MAYNNYLIKIGTYILPMNVIKASSYKVTYSVLDQEAYRDAAGVLHRVSIRKVPSVEVVINSPNNYVIENIFQSIASQYTNANEKKMTASVYIPEINAYYEGSFYLPDTQFSINRIEGAKVFYDDVTLKIIGY